jgi:hypothetical protein
MLLGCACGYTVSYRSTQAALACGLFVPCGVRACVCPGLRGCEPSIPTTPDFPQSHVRADHYLHTYFALVSIPPTAVQNRKVLSMSLGGGGTSAASDTAIANANDLGLGAPVAVAAGNDNEDACNYTPANSPKGA